MQISHNELNIRFGPEDIESSCPSRRIPDGSIQLLIEAPEFQPRAGDLEDIVAELMVNVVISHSFLGLTEAGIRRETLHQQNGRIAVGRCGRCGHCGDRTAPITTVTSPSTAQLPQLPQQLFTALQELGY